MTPTLLVNIVSIFVFVCALAYILQYVYIATIVYFTDDQGGGGDSGSYTLLDGVILFLVAGVAGNDDFRTAALLTLGIIVALFSIIYRAVRWAFAWLRKRFTE